VRVYTIIRIGIFICYLPLANDIVANKSLLDRIQDKSKMEERN